MADDLQVECNRGCLVIECGAEAFGRLRDAVLDVPDVAEASGVPAGDVTRIMIGLKKYSTVPSGRLRDRVALLGCGVVACVVLLVFVVGISTIVGWMR